MESPPSYHDPSCQHPGPAQGPGQGPAQGPVYAHPPGPVYYPPQQPQPQVVVVQQYVAPPTYAQHVDPNVLFRDLMRKHEIRNEFAGRLLNLQGFEIVILCDDSGSMNTPTNNGAGGLGMTRWRELATTVNIVVDIASLMDPTGIDLYFLNRDPVLNVRDGSQLRPVFDVAPSGGTNIARTLRQILRDKTPVLKERKLLILIATDGEPTNDHGNIDTATLRNILRNERNPIDKVFVTFLACTDDQATMEYLNKWDKEIKNLDVVDDYASERAEILKVQGTRYRFTFGDYVVKALMGGIDKFFDKLDEKKVGGCCVIL